MKSAAELFWPKVNVGWTHDCWNWTGSVYQSNGYGQFGSGRNKGLSTLAHRASYQMIKGHVSDSMHIDHLCRNILCVNPAHLEAVTPAENSRREREANGEGRKHFSMNKGKTHCKHGHSNWEHYKGRRHCIDCRGGYPVVRDA